MNVTLNTYNNFNRYNYNNKQNMQSPVFTGTPEKVIADVAKKKSSFFDPFTKQFDKMTTWLAKDFSSKVLNSKYFAKAGDKLKNTDNLYQHCMALGSVITSGLYMQRTLNNKNMDKDRRNTLAVNQFLTLVLSTAGSYTLDKYLKGWWENVTAKYVEHQVGDSKFSEDFKSIKKSIQGINKSLKADTNADVTQLVENAKKGLSADASSILEGVLKKATEDGDKVKSLKAPDLKDFIDKLVKKERIVQPDSLLNKKIKGMGILRTMIVFGFVYRYFVPVAVTKPANKLCDMYLQNKKAKEAQKAKEA